jgi:hypothetical protein
MSCVLLYQLLERLTELKDLYPPEVDLLYFHLHDLALDSGEAAFILDKVIMICQLLQRYQLRTRTATALLHRVHLPRLALLLRDIDDYKRQILGGRWHADGSCDWSNSDVYGEPADCSPVCMLMRPFLSKQWRGPTGETYERLIRVCEELL